MTTLHDGDLIHDGNGSIGYAVDEMRDMRAAGRWPYPMYVTRERSALPTPASSYYTYDVPVTDEDLLAACKMALENAHVAQLRAAIAKAEGRE